MTHLMWVETLSALSELMLITGVGFIFYGLVQGIQPFLKME